MCAHVRVRWRVCVRARVFAPACVVMRRDIIVIVSRIATVANEHNALRITKNRHRKRDTAIHRDISEHVIDEASVCGVVLNW